MKLYKTEGKSLGLDRSMAGKVEINYKYSLMLLFKNNTVLLENANKMTLLI